MDKWEDTVMTWKQIVECSHNPVLELRERDICQTQAEITWPIAFKAGEDKGKQEGREEVVEWIEKNRTRIGRSGNNYVYLGLAWQAFLKERVEK